MSCTIAFTADTLYRTGNDIQDDSYPGFVVGGAARPCRRTAQRRSGPEAGDHFGAASVGTSDDGSCIGVPGEDLGAKTDTGRVVCDRGGKGLNFDNGDFAGAGDRYGARLSALSDRNFTGMVCYRIGGQRMLIDAPDQCHRRRTTRRRHHQRRRLTLRRRHLGDRQHRAGNRRAVRSHATTRMLRATYAPCDNG